MSFLRIGTACVVVNERGDVLLSQRGDLKTWNLPGGRLDRGETLEAAAAREVREETGIEAKIERAVGLYYTTRWRRLNVLFKAQPVGGRLLGKTHETLSNGWFPVDALPSPIAPLSRLKIGDALSGGTILRVIETPLAEYLKLRWKFGWRWVRNLLNRRPEPRYPRFDVCAVGMGSDGRRHRVSCDGRSAPWEALALEMPLSDSERDIQWLDVQHDVRRGVLELIFAVGQGAHSGEKGHESR